MAESVNNDLQAEASGAILKRIAQLAPKASASELKKLADAYVSVSEEASSSHFDPRSFFGRQFDPFGRFADDDVD